MPQPVALWDRFQPNSGMSNLRFMGVSERGWLTMACHRSGTSYLLPQLLDWIDVDRCRAQYGCRWKRRLVKRVNITSSPSPNNQMRWWFVDTATSPAPELCRPHISSQISPLPVRETSRHLNLWTASLRSGCHGMPWCLLRRSCWRSALSWWTKCFPIFAVQYFFTVPLGF